MANKKKYPAAKTTCRSYFFAAAKSQQGKTQYRTRVQPSKPPTSLDEMKKLLDKGHDKG